ncbi:hypothetical protein OG474_11940 [Kribbella sp. NBC_01505]|uniref:hypothetical protein n=1 Tax=Kribbella sp. NBC_01505 TaxID=2903580 RepID=UPI00386A374A
MNLQDLRSELNSRADEAANGQPDLLPGVRNKIRRTKQRRTATALASVAAVAALAVAVVPGVINNSTPDPAENVPSDYTKDDRTVPGMVNGSKLLKAWISDRNQAKASFAWTPTTDKIAIYASCDTAGSTAPMEIRVKIGDWNVGSTQCNVATDTETENLPLTTLRSDSAIWLASPVGKSATVTAEIVNDETGKADTSAKSAQQFQLGIYTAADTPVGSSDGPPEHVPVAGPDDYRSGGVVYRKTIGGDTLAGAAVGDPGTKEVKFSFTSTGAPLVLHQFCTANGGSVEDQPFRVQTSLNGSMVSEVGCDASSTDAGAGGSHTVQSPPAGQKVDVVARIVIDKGQKAALPADARLGLGAYFQGKQRFIEDVGLAERIEVGGNNYRLAAVQEAPGTAGKVSIETPADTPLVLAYGSSTLGINGPAMGEMSFQGRSTGKSISAEQSGLLGNAWLPFAAGPASRAEMTLTKGKATKGKLFVAIYLPA